MAGACSNIVVAAAFILDLPISAPGAGAATRKGSIKEGSDKHDRASSWAQPETIALLLFSTRARVLHVRTYPCRENMTKEATSNHDNIPHPLEFLIFPPCPCPPNSERAYHIVRSKHIAAQGCGAERDTKRVPACAIAPTRPSPALVGCESRLTGAQIWPVRKGQRPN